MVELGITASEPAHWQGAHNGRECEWCFHALVHNAHIYLAKAHFYKVLQDTLHKAAKGIIVGVDGAVFWSTERIAGRSVLKRGGYSAGRSLGDALADFFDDNRVVSYGHVGAVRFDTACRYEQRVACLYVVMELVWSHVFELHELSCLLHRCS